MNNEVSHRQLHWLKWPAMIAALAILIVTLAFFVRSYRSDPPIIVSTLDMPQDVADLITTEKYFKHEDTYTHKWCGSRKTLILAAHYHAHGGIDLMGPDPIQIIIPEGDRRLITAEGLHGKLISCEMVEGSLRVVKDDGGIWNRLTPEDRAIAVNKLNATAREKVMKEGLKSQAEEGFLKFLKEEVGLEPTSSEKGSPFPSIWRRAIESIKRQLNS